MLHKMYSIRDTKSEMFNVPFYSKTHGEAERNFSQVVNDPKTQIAQFPSDFDLYYVGEYDDNQGTIQSKKVPELISNASTLVRKTGLNAVQ